MSERCEHNDHTHIVLWLAVFFLGTGIFNDCNSGLQDVKRQNAALLDRVERLEQRR